jgi:hypothetical protein
MSVWTTKTLNKNANYIVIRHSLRGVNGNVYGIKFRDSYGVVEKDSKLYAKLKKMPMFKGNCEFPLLFLAKLPFITRPLDIKQVYGQEVYTKYLQAVEDEQRRAELAKIEEKKQIQEKRVQELEKVQEIQEKLKEAQESEDLEKIEQLKAEMPQVTKCSYITVHDTLCAHDAWECSPSGYCKLHVVDDPRLEEFDIKKPMAMTKSEKKKFRAKVYEKLEKLKKQGKF